MRYEEFSKRLNLHVEISIDVDIPLLVNVNLQFFYGMIETYDAPRLLDLHLKCMMLY